MMIAPLAVVAINYYGGVGSLGHFMKIVSMPYSKFDVGRWMFDVHSLFDYLTPGRGCSSIGKCKVVAKRPKATESHHTII